MTPPRLAIGACLLGLLLGGCAGVVSDKYEIKDDPVTLQPVDGSPLQRVTLTDRAAQRLGIEISEVEDQIGGLVVPSGALWLDTEGVFWVYTSPGPNTFLRHPVAVEDDNGRFAVLSSGPPPGTRVVVVGVPELYGAEVGVGK